MGVLSEDIVVLQHGKESDDPSVVTVSCPDKTGLACDLCWIILEFGLCITKADVTQVLCDLEYLIHRVKVSTMPDGRVMDLLFITDGMELLHTKKRQDDTCEHLKAVLGDSCISCELQLAGPEYEGFQLGFSSLPLAVEEELFSSELSNEESYSHALAPDLKQLKKADITFDNSLSPAHTLLQLYCFDQKSLFYDIMRTQKDCNIKIAYSCFFSIRKGWCDVDLFIHQMDGKKILDPERQSVLSSCLKTEMLNPFRVLIASHGPDT